MIEDECKKEFEELWWVQCQGEIPKALVGWKNGLLIVLLGLKADDIVKTRGLSGLRGLMLPTVGASTEGLLQL
jgi:hypothetical protein